MDAKFESVHSRRGVVYALQRSIERFLVGDGQLIVSTGFDEHAQKDTGSSGSRVSAQARTD